MCQHFLITEFGNLWLEESSEFYFCFFSLWFLHTDGDRERWNAIPTSCPRQWRIHIVQFWTHPPLGFQILSISCSLWKFLAKSYVGPLEGWCLHLLDPLLFVIGIGISLCQRHWALGPVYTYRPLHRDRQYIYCVNSDAPFEGENGFLTQSAHQQPVAIGTMLNFGGDGDSDSHGMCKQALKRYSQSHWLLSYRPFPKKLVAGMTPRGRSPIDGFRDGRVERWNSTSQIIEWLEPWGGRLCE